jgi:hypothetical protein
MQNHEHALTTLLWCSVDPDSGEPLDSAEFRPSLELQNRVAADWQRFRDAAEAMGFDAEEHCAQMLHPDNEGDAWNAAAHDFILTRQGHGTGFWDCGRWHAPWGDRLTDLCKQFGELDCYVSAGVVYPES